MDADQLINFDQYGVEKRQATREEVLMLLDYIELLKVYLTDDHRCEMEEENQSEYDLYEALIEELS